MTILRIQKLGVSFKSIYVLTMTLRELYARFKGRSLEPLMLFGFVMTSLFKNLQELWQELTEFWRSS